MPTLPRIAAALSGQPDLYAALRQACRDGPVPMAALMAVLDRETAARLASVDPGLLTAIMRKGAGGPAIPSAPALRAHLAGLVPAPLFRPDPAQTPTIALLTAGQHPDMPAFSDRAFEAWFAARNRRYGLGAYGEHRTVYETDQFADAASPERRTVHLGIDVFAPAGTPIYAPIAGRVLSATYNADPLDYGNTLILQHDGPSTFFTLYGHLAPLTLSVGQIITPGQPIARLGDWPENGGWAAHVHFQVMSDMLSQSGNFFGVGHVSLLDVWTDILLDPNLILRIPEAKFRL